MPIFDIAGLEKHSSEKHFDQSVSLASLICLLNVETWHVNLYEWYSWPICVSLKEFAAKFIKIYFNAILTTWDRKPEIVPL